MYTEQSGARFNMPTATIEHDAYNVHVYRMLGANEQWNELSEL